MNPMAEYKVRRIHEDFSLPGEPRFWEAIPPALVNHYLWLKNGYEPRVEARACYSPNFLYIFFKAWEPKIRIRYTQFQDPVWKDSCVEFFIDPFPEKKLGYINIETNAVGAMLIHFGPGRGKRESIPREALGGFEIIPSVKKPVDGPYGADMWTLAYRLPLALFDKYYRGKVAPGRLARANFYKCGDETEVPHYGAWNTVETPKPDFHRPEYFGQLVFL
jgi:hypothetical protein